MQLDVAPHALPFVAMPNAFTAAELDEIERIGDAHAAAKATLVGVPPRADYGSIRVTETAWLDPTEELRWLYDKMGQIMQVFNERLFKFDLTGFYDPFQYTVYRASEGGHYDWHADHGAITPNPRKLSFSLQLSDAASYQGCDLETRTSMNAYAASRERGTVIAFPSYVLHRVTPITSGTRKSLVAWAVGPQFR